MDNELKSTEMLKEIDLIQSCITRMANNSFLLKGWMLSLIIAFIALIPKDINRFYICIIVMAIDLAFWYLDAYYLKQERLFRWKYEWVIINRPLGIINNLYNLNPCCTDMWLPKDNKPRKEPYVIKVMLTKSLIPLYGGIFISLLLLIIFKYHQ
jgi:hypothetical protein